MVQRTASATDSEPEQSDFTPPSEKEHLFQVVEVYDQQNHPERLIIDDPDVVYAKCEVVGGEEEGRGILNRLTLNDNGKGFWATRLLLKAIGEKYKGDNFPIDTENWTGKQFYATVVHDGKYCNIKEYNFDKLVEQPVTGTEGGSDKETKPDGGEPVEWDAE
jgi:hypothetical protein